MESVQSSKSIVYQSFYAIVILSFSLLANSKEPTNQEPANKEKTEINQPKSEQLKSEQLNSEQLNSANVKSKPEQTELSNSKKTHKLTNSVIESKIQNLLKQSKRNFEYSQAAKYTHLKWSERMNKYSVGLLPIQNYSGIPIEERHESADYYDHGKLPIEINHLFYDALTTSRQFILNQRTPDYWLQLTIEEYHQPLPFAANDKWWQTARDTVDRAFTSAKPATVKLSLKVTAGDRPFKRWKDSASMTISNCDLNTTPQDLSSVNSQNQTIKDYLTTTPGQAFLSASNFLIMQAVRRLAEEVDYAYIEKIVGDEIYLKSENSSFKVGETLKVHYSVQAPDSSPFNTKQIRVIKAAPGYAIAYPFSIRGDHLKIGDLVKTNSRHPFELPDFRFNSSGQCAEVIVAQAE